MRVTLLGTGTSTGVPIIGCPCNTCTSEDPRDRRLRCAAHIQCRNLSIVIDTGPDFRTQMLRAGIGRLDAVLWTHHHFDHVAGLDDLRPFFFECPQRMPCYTHPSSARILERTYAYVFQRRGGYAGRLDLRPETGPFTVQSRYGQPGMVPVTPIEALHGGTCVYGYRIGAFAYLTDVNEIPAPAYGRLHGVHTLVLGALRERPHKKHLSIGEAVRVARKVKASRTILVHLTHSVLHAAAASQLPAGITLGHDQLVLNIPAN